MQKLIWHTEIRKVSNLKIWDENPRQITKEAFEKLKERIVMRGFHDVVKIDTDNTILSGNQRKRALEDLKIKEVSVMVPNRKLTLEERQKIALESNRNDGDWNLDILANWNEDLMKDVGWSSDELDEIFGLDRAEDFNEQKEFEKAVKEPRGVKTGDIWQIGEHKLIVGDCTKKENWEKLLGQERFNFMFTDPPCRLAYAKNRRRKVKTKEGWKTKGQREYETVGTTDKQGKPRKGFGAKQNRFYEGVEMSKGVPAYNEWLSLANEFQNPKGANVMIFENWRNTHDLWEAIEKYWKLKNMIIWHLPNRHQGFAARGKFFQKYDIVPLAGDGVKNESYEKEFDEYLRDKGQKLLDTYEIILFGHKGDAAWSKIKSKKWWTIGDHITWTASSEAESKQNVIFGTKPIQILVPYIKILSPRGGVIMDPFVGSGSTIIASEIMKRRCFAIEISPTYVEVILNRVEKFTGLKAEKQREAKL
jgi:site-specific DNA-methyltransferase (adenine-specific)